MIFWHKCLHNCIDIRWLCFFHLFLVVCLFYSTIFVWQHCVSFCYTAKWIHDMYTSMPSFLALLTIQVTTAHWGEFLVFYSMFLLAVYFIHSISVCMCQAQSPSSSHRPSPVHPTTLPFLVSTRFFSVSMSLFLLWKITFNFRTLYFRSRRMRIVKAKHNLIDERFYPLNAI